MFEIIYLCCHLHMLVNRSWGKFYHIIYRNRGNDTLALLHLYYRSLSLTVSPIQLTICWNEAELELLEIVNDIYFCNVSASSKSNLTLGNNQMVSIRNFSSYNKSICPTLGIVGLKNICICLDGPIIFGKMSSKSTSPKWEC